MNELEIYADEAWTHQNDPRRYHTFFGGILGTSAELDRFDQALQKVIASHGLEGEIKWSKLSSANFDGYSSLISGPFAEFVAADRIKYRQMFLDRSYVGVDRGKNVIAPDAASQFKLYYQFIKHGFGLRYLPAHLLPARVRVRLDDYSNQDLKRETTTFVEMLDRTYFRLPIQMELLFMNSKKSRRLQVCDLLIGAAGSYGNKMQLLRADGRRGMSDKQKLRLEFSKIVYNELRAIDAATRGSKAFNWFETTGLAGDLSNLFSHPMRMWKFKPARHIRDFGWENDHLGRHGEYLGPIYE